MLGEARAAGEVPDQEGLLETAARRLGRPPSLRPVLNATGVIIHTNLGRAPLAEVAIERVGEVAAGYSTLEYDLAAGGRGSRHDHLSDLLSSLTGAEAGLAVNNNAAAVLLCLAATAGGGEVLISRGQLIEIGDGFRIPDILAQSGARLVEVGTTNRTSIADYRRAITSETRAILRVHQSNFRIVGFTAHPGLGELAEVAGGDVALIDDLGSGALLDLPDLLDEPTARASIEAGADLVCFSGDKLLGGPQAGIIVGTAEAVATGEAPPAGASDADRQAVAGGAGGDAGAVPESGRGARADAGAAGAGGAGRAGARASRAAVPAAGRRADRDDGEGGRRGPAVAGAGQLRLCAGGRGRRLRRGCGRATRR